jgi:hypothetical protein
MQRGIAETWSGFLYVVAATFVAVIVAKPAIEWATQKLTKRSAENLLSFGKAA